MRNSGVVRILKLSILAFNVCSTHCFGAKVLNTVDKMELDRSIKAIEEHVVSVILFGVAQVIWILVILLCVYRQKCTKVEGTDENDTRIGRMTTNVRHRPGYVSSIMRDSASSNQTALSQIPIPTSCTGAVSTSMMDEKIINYSIATLDDSELLCPICLDLFESEKDSACLSCSHVFHLLCLQKWIVKTPIPVCPVCRHDLRIHL